MSLSIYKQQIINAAAQNDLPLIQEILATPTFSISDKVQLIMHCNADDVSVLMFAVQHQNLEMIQLIFAIPELTAEDKFDILMQYDIRFLNVLMIAAEQNNIAVAQGLLLEINSLSIEKKHEVLEVVLADSTDNEADEGDDDDDNDDNVTYQTALDMAVRSDHLDIAYAILESYSDFYPLLMKAVAQHDTVMVKILFLKTIDIKKKSALLTQTDEQGRTAIHIAAQNQTQDMFSFLIHEVLIVSVENIRLNNLNTMGELLNIALPRWQVNLLKMSDQHILRHTLRLGNLAALELLLRDLNIEQKRSLLTTKIHNQTLFAFAQQQGFDLLTQWLQAVGKELTLESLIAPIKPVHDKQNTHIATIHESYSRSVIKLVARYLDVSEKDSRMLNTWAMGSKGDINDSINHDAILLFMKKESTQQLLFQLTKTHEADITQWINMLDLTNSLQAAAKRAILLMKTKNEYVAYVESSSNVNLKQLFTLIWIGVHDCATFTPNRDIITQCKDRLDGLIQYLFQIQRDGNLDDNDQDLHPDSADRKPKCQGGCFNHLVTALLGRHPDVRIFVLTKEMLTFKAMSLMSELLSIEVLSHTEVTELRESLNDSFELTNPVKNQLREKIQAKLIDTYSENIANKQINIENLKAVIKVTLERPTLLEIEKIIIKIINYNPRIGYYLELLDSLPKSGPLYGCVYVSTTGTYIVRDRANIIQQGQLPIEICGYLSHLEQELQNIQLKNRILHFTSSIGHTAPMPAHEPYEEKEEKEEKEDTSQENSKHYRSDENQSEDTHSRKKSKR